MEVIKADGGDCINVKIDNTELENKIKEFEINDERRERKERRNNLIISGIVFNKKNLKGNVNLFLKNKIGVEANLSEVWSLKEDKYGIKLTSLEDKMQILKAKNKLKGSKIYINEDMTKKEIQIQKAIREKVNCEKTDNPNIKVVYKYKKVKIDDVWWEWCEKGQELFRS